MNTLAFQALKKAPKIGRNRLLSEAAGLCLPKVDKDLKAVAQNGLDLATIEVDIAAFEDFVDALAQDFPDSSQKQTLFRACRQLACSIELRANTLGGKQALVTFKLRSIAAKIGTVPLLNDTVAQPDAKFLPPQYQASITRWNQEPWKTPARSKGDGSEKVSFYTKMIGGSKYASVRLHLIDLDRNISPEGESLSYGDADFFAHGDLQADHLQPSEHLLERQLELIAMMNADPLFKAKMQAHPMSQHYFVEHTTTHEVVGTKRFFMDYHNAMDNLWLLRPADNSGTGKSNADPVTWLQQHSRFGDRFMQTVGPINTTNILYTTKDGRVLAKAVREWFQATYRQEITGVKFYGEKVIDPFKQLLLDTSKPGPLGKVEKHAKVATMAAMAVASQAASIAAEAATRSDESGLSSVESADAAINSKNLGVVSGLAVAKRDEQSALIGSIATDYKAAKKRARIDAATTTKTGSATPSFNQ